MVVRKLVCGVPEKGNETGIHFNKWWMYVSLLVKSQFNWMIVSNSSSNYDLNENLGATSTTR